MESANLSYLKFVS